MGSQQSDTTERLLLLSLLIWRKERLVVRGPTERLLRYSRQKMGGVWYRTVPLVWWKVDRCERYLESFVWIGCTSSSKAKTWLLGEKLQKKQKLLHIIAGHTLPMNAAAVVKWEISLREIWRSHWGLLHSSKVSKSLILTRVSLCKWETNKTWLRESSLDT